MRIFIYVAAVLITAFILTTASWVIFSGGFPFPKDALIIQTHGQNDKILKAISSLNLEYVKTIDTASIRRASFISSLKLNIIDTSVMLVVLLSITHLLKLVLKPKKAEQGAAANP